MLRAGMVLSDRYEIIRKIGSGGMSEVYQAKDQKLNRFVAVKVLKDEFKEDKSFVSKFSVEAQAAASLSHQNIVNVYDVGNDDEIYYIVMEYVEGITLKEYINKKVQLAIDEVVHIGLQIAAGIEQAHKNHIIHRDIKPQNMIITEDGTVKVTDFGIAKASNSSTITAGTVGSVHYISPEQARGGYIDEKSDIYSLGITLYEMATGRVPYEGDNNVSVALLHIQGQMRKARELRNDIPIGLEAIIIKATQKKPDQRYLTANELIQDLKKLLTNPNENFVKFNFEPSDAPTVMMSEKEVDYIKKESEKIRQFEQQSEELEEDLEDEGPILKLNKTKRKSNAKPTNKANKDEDFTDEEDINPNLEKLTMILGVVAAILVVTVISVFVFKSFAKPQDKVKEPEVVNGVETPFAVPTITGKSLEEAKAILSDLDLTIDVLRYEATSDQPKDYIIEQQPSGGSMVNKGDKISVIISSGAELIKTPMVTGFQFNDAERAITNEGLLVSKELEYHDEIPMGTVIRQYPEANTELRKGDTVAIIVSNGREIKEVSVPNLKDLTEEAAKAKLVELKLNVGKITYHDNESVEKGRVISQGIAANEKVSEGYLVDLAISNGPKQTYTIVHKLENIFEDDKTQGMVRLELTQGGISKIVYDEFIFLEDFPISVTIQGEKGEGVLKLFVDDMYKYRSWTITFGEGD